MNAARQRRVALQKRIREQKRQEELQYKKDRIEYGKLRCQHKVRLADICRACEDELKPLYEEYLKQPDVMEFRLRQSLGLNAVKRAFVFLKALTVYGPKIVTVWLSTHRPTQQIMDMKKNGFWANDHGYLTWFDPDQITEVCFDNE